MNTKLNYRANRLAVRLLTIVAMAAAQTAMAETVTYTISGHRELTTSYLTVTASGSATGTTNDSWDITSTSERTITLSGGISFKIGTDKTTSMAVDDNILKIQANGSTGGYITLSHASKYIYHVTLKDNNGTVIHEAWNMTKSHTYRFQTIYVKTIVVEYATAIPFTDAVISGLSDSYPVSNAAVEPVPTVTWRGTTLTNNTHYTLSYQNNTAAGTATVTAIGKGIFSTSSSVSEDYTLEWTTYSVRFNKNADDASGTMSDQAFYYTEEKALTANAFTRAGYYFGRWTTNADGTGDTYTDGQSVSNLTAENGATVDLYAQWNRYALKRVDGIDYSPEPTSSDDTYHYYAAGTVITLTPTHEHKIITGVSPTTILNATIAANQRSATITMPSQDVKNLFVTQYEVYAVTLPEGITLTPSSNVYHIEGTTYCRYYDATTWYTLKAPFGYSVSNATYDGSPTTINNGNNGFYLKQNDAEVTATLIDQFGISNDADGTLTKPYVITTPEGLTLLTTYSFNQTSDKYFELGNDITYTPTGADDEHNFDGIQSFGGTFDGKGKTISGIRIYQSSSEKGLFRNIDGGTVKNVVLNNARVRSSSKVGGITGYVNNGTIQNCLVLNSVITETDNNNYKGVIAGNTSLSSYSNNLYRNSSVNGQTYNVGVYNHDQDGACEAFTITLPTGVSAASSKSLTYDGTTYHGSYLNTVTLTYSPLSEGSGEALPSGKVPLFTVTSVDNSSLVAETLSTFTMPKADVSVSVELCDGYTLTLPDGLTATGISITNGSDTYYLSGTTISLSYQAEGYEVVYSVNGTPIEGNTFTITANTDVTVATNDVWGIAGGADGSERSPYVITTTAGLDLLANKVNGTGGYSQNNYSGNKYFCLGDDITYTHKAANEEGADTENNYTPIGNNSYIFQGTFDGQGHTVSGIRIYRSGNSDPDSYLGLFGYNRGTVKNVTVSDARITGYAYVGGIAGRNYDSVSNCHASNTVAIHAVNEEAYDHGGIVGASSQGSVYGCTSAATLTYVTSCSAVGGIVGYNSYGSVVNCLAIDASVAGTSEVGTIVGNFHTEDYLHYNYYSGCTINGEPQTEGVGTGYGDMGDNDSALPAIALRNSPPSEGSGEVPNSSVIAANTGSKNVVLYGRTLYKDGDWNTLCLPFSLDERYTSNYLGGADIRTLSSASFSEGTLTLNFTPEGAVTSITAGVPYIVRWEKASDYDTADPFTRDLVNPAFRYVNIPDDYADGSVTTDFVNFIGTTSPVVFDAGTAHKDVLFLGSGNTLYYPDGAAATTIGACRAYFQLNNGLTAGESTDPNAPSVRAFTLNFGDGEAQGITTTDFTDFTDKAGAWYTLDGRKLDGKPTRKGLYINNGKKVVVK